LQQGGQIPTYSESQFNGWADSLYTAMDGFGTDEDTIKSVFHYMQNKADVLKLIKSFGIRKRVYNAFVVAGDDLNLNQWLTEEVTTETLAEINNELKTKNINYTF